MSDDGNNNIKFGEPMMYLEYLNKQSLNQVGVIIGSKCHKYIYIHKNIHCSAGDLFSMQKTSYVFMHKPNTVNNHMSGILFINFIRIWRYLQKNINNVNYKKLQTYNNICQNYKIPEANNFKILKLHLLI